MVVLFFAICYTDPVTYICSVNTVVRYEEKYVSFGIRTAMEQVRDNQPVHKLRAVCTVSYTHLQIVESITVIGRNTLRFRLAGGLTLTEKFEERSA